VLACCSIAMASDPDLMNTICALENLVFLPRISCILLYCPVCRERYQACKTKKRPPPGILLCRNPEGYKTALLRWANFTRVERGIEPPRRVNNTPVLLPLGYGRVGISAALESTEGGGFIRERARTLFPMPAAPSSANVMINHLRSFPN
jgi:hypothetical protein